MPAASSSSAIGGMRDVAARRRPARQRGVVAARVAAHDAAQRLRQERELVHRRQRREDDVARAPRAEQPVGERGAVASARRVVNLIDDVVDAGDDDGDVGAERRRRRASRSWTARVVRPVRAQQRPLDAPAGRRCSVRTRWPTTAWSWWATPTPAADESPATSRRSVGAPAAPTRPSRSPAASGSTGARRRVAQRLRDQQRRERELEGQGAAPDARAAALRRPALPRLRTGEVGLALLEEGTERFLRFGALQAGAAGAPTLRVLVAGDSSAAGVGVARQEQAVIGHLVRTLHRADRTARIEWALRARTGLTTRGVHELLVGAAPFGADVAVVITGVNDVIGQVPTRRAVRDRAALADWLLGPAGVRHVVFAPLPPMHRFPLLPEPLRRVMGGDAGRTTPRWRAGRRRAATFRMPP